MLTLLLLSLVGFDMRIVPPGGQDGNAYVGESLSRASLNKSFWVRITGTATATNSSVTYYTFLAVYPSYLKGWLDVPGAQQGYCYTANSETLNVGDNVKVQRAYIDPVNIFGPSSSPSQGEGLWIFVVTGETAGDCVETFLEYQDDCENTLKRLVRTVTLQCNQQPVYGAWSVETDFGLPCIPFQGSGSGSVSGSGSGPNGLPGLCGGFISEGETYVVDIYCAGGKAGTLYKILGREIEFYDSFGCLQEITVTSSPIVVACADCTCVPSGTGSGPGTGTGSGPCVPNAVICKPCLDITNTSPTTWSFTASGFAGCADPLGNPINLNGAYTLTQVANASCTWEGTGPTGIVAKLHIGVNGLGYVTARLSFFSGGSFIAGCGKDAFGRTAPVDCCRPITFTCIGGGVGCVQVPLHIVATPSGCCPAGSGSGAGGVCSCARPADTDLCATFSGVLAVWGTVRLVVAPGGTETYNGSAPASCGSGIPWPISLVCDKSTGIWSLTTGVSLVLSRCLDSLTPFQWTYANASTNASTCVGNFGVVITECP